MLQVPCCIKQCLLCVAGAPEIGFDVDNVRPAWALIIPAAILLLAGKPLSGSRSFGNLRAKLPLISDDAVARVSRPNPAWLLLMFSI